MDHAQENAAEADIRGIVDSDATKKDKIPRLHDLGLKPADIAKWLGCAPGYVYSVLKGPAPGGESSAPRSPIPAAGAAGHGPGGTGEASPGAFAVRGAPSAERLDPVRVALAPGGLLAIPGPFMAALGIEDEDDVFLEVKRDEIRVYSRATAIRQVQELVARHDPPLSSLVDVLIGERRREARKEEGDA